MSPEKLQSFIRRRLLSAGERVNKFTLVHVSAEEKNSVIHTHERAGSGTIEEETQSIAEELADEAEGHANSYTRDQRYSVVAYSDSGKVLGQYAFRLKPQPSDVAAGESEPPTPTGALALSMRLTESFARMNMTGFGGLLQASIEENARLRKRCGELEQRLEDSFEERELLRSNAHEREMDRLKLEAAEGRKDRIIDQIKPMIPILLPKVIGLLAAKSGIDSPLPALKEAEKSARVEEKGIREKLFSFFNSLDEGQLTKISEVLKPEQLQALMGLVAEIGENENGVAESGTIQRDERGDQQSVSPTGNGQTVDQAPI